jgi:hypothetical protein
MIVNPLKLKRKKMKLEKKINEKNILKNKAPTNQVRLLKSMRRITRTRSRQNRKIK